MTNRQKAFVGALSIALATVAVYAASLRGGFVYDDYWAIQRNDALGNDSFRHYWTNPDTGADPSSGLTKDVYRPLTVSSFALSLKLWGRNLMAWRLENLMWHFINGILFALLLRRLGFRWAPGLFAVAIFLLHPLQVSSVAWIYQRSTLISAAGVLAALLVSLRPDIPAYARMGVSLLFLMSALFAKESAIVFPLLFWVISANKMAGSQRKIYAAVFMASVCSFILLRSFILGSLSQITDIPRGWWEKSILTLIAFPQYTAKLVVPWGLRASYDLPTLTPARMLIALLGMGVLGYGLYRLYRNPSRTPWSFALWTLIALIPMLPLAPIRAFFAERFFYVSLMGAAALAGLLFEQRRALRPLAFLWLVSMSGVTFCYARAWVSNATLWSWTVRQEPTNAFAHMCLAETLTDPQAATVQYFQALANQPSPEMTLAAWNNLAVLSLDQQQPEKALYWTAQVLHRRPDSPQALYNRWRALNAVGETRQANALRKILLKDPRIPVTAFR